MESKYDLDAEHFVKTLQSIRVTLDGFFSEPETLADRVKLTKTRDALLIAQARAECAERVWKQIKIFRDAALAYKKLGVCYRLGSRPTETLFKALEKADKTLEQPEDALRLAITQGAQGQSEPRDALIEPMDKIETPRECAQRFDPCARGEFVGLDEAEKIITARDAAIRAETAKDVMRWFDNYRKERGQSGNEAALHKSLCAAICRKEVVG